METSPESTPGSGPERSEFDRMGGAPVLKSLLQHFYADIRQDSVLGPIFNSRIHDWPSHLEKIGAFWARQTGASSNYSGGFAAAHLPLGIQPEHFTRWLGLWERNCRQHLNPDSADWMILRAHEIAGHLKRITSGAAGLTIDESPRRTSIPPEMNRNPTSAPDSASIRQV